MRRISIVFGTLALLIGVMGAGPPRAEAACIEFEGRVFWCPNDWYLASRGAVATRTPAAATTSTAVPASPPVATPTSSATAIPTAARSATSTPAPTVVPAASPTAAPTQAPAPAPAFGKVLQDFGITRNDVTLTVPVYSSLPLSTSSSAVTRAAISVHGTNRNAVDYFDYATKAVPGDVLVVAPRFLTSSEDPSSSQLMWTNSAWKQGDDSSGGRPWQISSFQVTDELVRALRASYPNLDTVVMAGHSAGGQFVQRYAAASTVGGLHFVVANPSSYLYFGPERPSSRGFEVPREACGSYNHYKYGLEDLGDVPYVGRIGASALKSRYEQATVTYLLGAEDDDPNASDLDTTCEAAAQGAHRLERGQQFFRHLELAYGDGVYGRHRLEIVSGVGHSASQMFGSSAGRAALVR